MENLIILSTTVITIITDIIEFNAAGYLNLFLKLFLKLNQGLPWFSF